MFKEFMENALILFVVYGAIFLIAIVQMSIEGEIDLKLPNDYARITALDYKAVVIDEPESNGKINVTERIRFNIHAASKSNPFWELWRDLVESNVDGLPVTYTVNSVKQILDDGTVLSYKESPKLYWDDSDFLPSSTLYGPNKWYHSPGPYSEFYRRYECLLFYVNGMYRETPTFVINYDMHNATLRYGDCSELYISPYSGDTIKYLESFTGQILVPDKDMPRTGNYEVYTYGTNASDFPITESDTLNPGYHTFSFNLDKKQLKFSPHNQYIEFALISYGDDKHIFSEYANQNKYSEDDVLQELRNEHQNYENTHIMYKNIKLAMLCISIIFSYLLIKFSLNIEKRIKKKYTFYKPEMEHYYFRDIPSDLDPNFAAHLVFCKTKEIRDTTDTYSAILLSLVRKGYVELEKIDPNRNFDNNNVNIVIKYTPKTFSSISNMDTLSNTTKELEPLTLSEEYYFNLILKYSTNNSVYLSRFQKNISNDYENTERFVKNIEDSVASIGVVENYFQKAKYKEPRNNSNTLVILFGVLSFFLIIFANLVSYFTPIDLAFGSYTILGIAFIISAILIDKKSKGCILLTQFGENEYAKWKGLYDFLNSETLMSERTVIELPLWEKYLVYATAFGISEKVTRALKVRCPDISSSPMLYNSYYHSTNFHHACHTISTSSRSAATAVRSGSHSYGYGGGGRGGGGGRRRSLILK